MFTILLYASSTKKVSRLCFGRQKVLINLLAEEFVQQRSSKQTIPTDTKMKTYLYTGEYLQQLISNGLWFAV